jgi:hypothetical protein
VQVYFQFVVVAMKNAVLIKALVLAFIWSGVCCSQILLIPVPFHGHFNDMDGLGRALIKRGHDVYVVLGSKTGMPIKGRDVGYKSLQYKQASAEVMSKHEQKALFQHGLLALPEVRHTLDTICDEMSGDEQLLQQVIQLQFDIAIVDNVAGALPCPFYVAYKANLTYIAFGKAMHTVSRLRSRKRFISIAQHT